MSIKYGEPCKDSKKIVLDHVQLTYYETVNHLSNYFNNHNNCTRNINYKCSSFIGYFNQMMSHCNLMTQHSRFNKQLFFINI